MAEENDLKSFQCGFESHLGHMKERIEFYCRIHGVPLSIFDAIRYAYRCPNKDCDAFISAALLEPRKKEHEGGTGRAS